MTGNDSPNKILPERLWLLLLFGFLWGLHLLALLLPTARLWGISHLLFLPPVYLYLFLIGGLLSLALLFPPLRSAGENIYTAVAKSLFEKPFRNRWLIVAVAAMLIFWFGRLPVFLLGDSYSIIENIGNELPVIFKWSEIGAIYLADTVARMLPISGSRLGEYAYGILSVISGAATIYLFCALAFELSSRAAGRFLIFCLLIFAGWIILFFGYTENYPVLWPFMTAYIYFGVRYINHKGSLIQPTLMLLLALVLHLQSLFFLISYPVIITARGGGARFYHRYKKLIWPAAAMVAVAAVILFIQKYHSSLELRLYITPLLKGHPAAPHYSLFSPAHLLDIVNQILLLVPLLPLLVALGWSGRKALVKDKTNFFLLLMSLGGLIFLFIIDPKLGMARDWDLFALCGLPPTLLFARLVAYKGKVRSALYPVLILVSMVTVMPFVATNLNRRPAIDYYKYTLNLDLPRSRTGLTILYQMAVAENDTIQADSIKEVVGASFPAARMAQQAHALADLGRYKEAMILVDSMAMFDPNSVELYNLRGLVNLKLGKYSSAVQDLEIAAQMGRYDARPLASLASAYNHLRKFDRMLDALQRGQKRDPNSTEINEGLMTAFYMTKQYDSALTYAKTVLNDRPNYDGAYFVAGNSSYTLGDVVGAKEYLEKYVELAPDGPRKTQVVEYLNSLEKLDDQ
jgi:Flp pilus assembly protein TadD